jgi:hypothetical protein
VYNYQSGYVVGYRYAKNAQQAIDQLISDFPDMSQSLQDHLIAEINNGTHVDYIEDSFPYAETMVA